jgi:hypothetical protein
MLSWRTLVAGAGLVLAAWPVQAAGIEVQADGVKEWLQKRLTVAEAEAAHMVRNDWLGPNPVPFGFVNGKWRALLLEMKEGDELWAFSSSRESWAHLGGRAGIALVRDGEVVDSLITARN